MLVETGRTLAVVRRESDEAAAMASLTATVRQMQDLSTAAATAPRSPPPSRVVLSLHPAGPAAHAVVCP